MPQRTKQLTMKLHRPPGRVALAATKLRLRLWGGFSAHVAQVQGMSYGPLTWDIVQVVYHGAMMGLYRFRIRGPWNSQDNFQSSEGPVGSYCC